MGGRRGLSGRSGLRGRSGRWGDGFDENVAFFGGWRRGVFFTAGTFTGLKLLPRLATGSARVVATGRALKPAATAAADAAGRKASATWAARAPRHPATQPRRDRLAGPVEPCDFDPVVMEYQSLLGSTTRTISRRSAS